MILLTLVLFTAGCVDMEESVTEPAENCSLEQRADTGEMYYSASDCYWGNHTPIEFLDELKKNPDKEVTIMQAPDDWIKKEHVEELIKNVDSTEPAAPLVSVISSYYPFNQSSTVGNEALFLIEGYRAGTYPPALCSVYYFKPDAGEVKTWWERAGKNGIIENRTAIQLVKNRYRDLNDYPSADGWPRAVDTESASDGMYVGFMQLGSGVPIISAECFFVGNDRSVRHTGTYNISQGMAMDISLRNCMP